MSIFIALLAGLLSFLSPCVLPMVPIYLGYLSGATVTPEGIVAARREAVTHAAAFVLGFTLIFVATWSALSVLTVIFAKEDIAKVAAIILLIFGIHFIGIIRIPFLYREARVEVRNRPLSYTTSLLTGMAFAGGWTPCIGPTLSGVIALAAQEATVLQGTGLLIVYSLGLGIPFMLVALGLGSASKTLKKFSPHMRKIEIASGVLLIVMATLLWFNMFQLLNARALQLVPDWLYRFW